MNNIEIFNETDKKIEELEEVKKVLDYAIKKEKSVEKKRIFIFLFLKVQM